MVMPASLRPGITFAVDPVKPATEPLQEAPAKNRLEALYGSGVEAHSDSIACITYSTRMRIGFIDTLHQAYAHHYPLILSPDHIWLFLLQGVNTHVRHNAKALRSLLVHHNGIETLTVRRDEFIKGSPHNAWPEVLVEFASQVRNNAKNTDFADTILRPFSTTSINEQISFNLSLMGIYQSYYTYEFETLCGIPSITLERSVADWQDLRQRIEMFAHLDLNDWLIELRPILDEFVLAALGLPDTQFWRNIYKRIDASGSSYLSGWIIRLMPYTSYMVRNRYESYPQNEDVFDRTGWMTVKEIPVQLFNVPLRWKYQKLTGNESDEYMMELMTGFVGPRQYADTLALRPEIGWAVRDTSLNHT